MKKPKVSNSLKLARACAIGLAAIAILLTSQFVLKEHGFLHTLFHEVGFALLVSLVVWGLFEAQLSQEAEEAWDERIERVTKNVFQAVLRKDLPKGLLDEANNLVLEAKLFRRNFSITYTLRDGSFNMGTRSGECVFVDAVMEFSMENVSTDVVDWAVCVALPNPVHADLKQACRVHSMNVSGGSAVELNMGTAEAAFREAIGDDTVTHVPFKLGVVQLQPGEVCNFSASYTMAKEAEDSELLATWYPADGLRVTIVDHGAPGVRKIFASSVHRHPVQQVAPQGAPGAAKIYTIPGYLLPQQGVLIWWKRTDAAGPAALASVAEQEV